jgi:peptide/nickel transport system substrate-binding protein
MKRQLRISLLAFVVLSLVLSACQTATPGPATQAPVPTEGEAATTAPEATEATAATEPSEATEAPAATEAQPAAEKGGSIAWATASEPESMDPACTFSSIADIHYKAVYDSLVFWSPEDQDFHPYLAESWDVSDDFMSYTFHLRSDVVFHDGTPFNAEAVKFNFDRIVAIVAEDCPQASVAQSRLGRTYTDAEVIDEFTVKVNFSAANPIFLVGAADLYFVAPSAVEEFGVEVGRNPVGTGAWKFKDWVEQSSLTVERNPDYNWPPATAKHTGPAYLEEITWQFLPEPTARYAALEAGEVHLVNRIEAEQFEELSSNPDLAYVQLAAPATPMGWVINGSLPPFDDPLVRQGIAHLVDRETMLDTLFGGFFKVGDGPLTKATWSYWPGVETYNTYEPETGLALLEQAGWTDSDGDGLLDKDGQPLTLTLLDLPTAANQSAWEFAQAQLLQHGVQLELEFAEAGVVVDECSNARRNICVLRWRMADPSTAAVMFESSGIVPGGFNWTHLPDEETDALFAAGASEPDREARAQIYADLQKRIMDQGIWLPIWDVQIVHGYDPRLKDWQALTNPEYVYLYDAYLEE